MPSFLPEAHTVVGMQVIAASMPAILEARPTPERAEQAAIPAPICPPPPPSPCRCGNFPASFAGFPRFPMPPEMARERPSVSGGAPGANMIQWWRCPAFAPMPHLPLLLALIFALLPASPVQARQDPVPVKAEVSRFLEMQSRSLPGEVRVQVGEFGSDNALAPCVQLEAFLPAGARAWGRVSVGIRCLAPATWTAYVPAEVRVTGLYLTTTGPISAGQVLSPADVRRQAGELTAQVADVLTDPAQAIGHVARISLAGGRPLAASHLRLPPAVLQGQAVKVVSRGAGFQVANDGVALSSAADGQGAQVRLANGQVVRGIARNGNIVEITLP